MPSTRQRKVGKLLQKELAEIFQTQMHSWFGGAFITVTEVTVTPDLKVAKVYLSFFDKKEKNNIMDVVLDCSRKIKVTLASNIRNQVRAIPDLNFYIDDTEEISQSVEEMFKKIDIPDENDPKYKPEDYKSNEE